MNEKREREGVDNNQHNKQIIYRERSRNKDPSDTHTNNTKVAENVEKKKRKKKRKKIKHFSDFFFPFSC